MTNKHARRQIIQTISLVLCFMAWSFSSHARTITLNLVNDVYPPYNSPLLPHDGLAGHIVRMALREAGFKVQIRYHPWKRVLSEATRGQADGIVGAWHKKERETHFFYSVPYVDNNLKLITRKNDFSNKATLGLIKGYAYDQKTLDSWPGEKLYLADFASAGRMLNGQRIDGILSDENVARKELNKLFPDWRSHIEIAPKAREQRKLHLLINKQHPQATQIIAGFNASLKKMESDGRLKEIYIAHGILTP